MSDTPSRYIYTMQHSREISDLLQSLFVAELIAPSRCIWLVSPWISDIPVIDNQSNQFTSLEPSWARKQVYISDVIARLVEMGTTVRIGTRDNDHNELFIERVTSKISEHNKFSIKTSPLLHNKGLLADDFYLNGSMNFTYNGISISEEYVQLVTNAKEIAENRVTFAARWGDEAP
ncbi:phosphatidylserine/phosphatidylglycerophosphate/cardiolipin synthase family protein [Paenibacillus sp. PR3]|uniref:Phosphatidylserine/phosphatidylglycerophosphate/ cardiolipin synthase family protein n=1 Tax=Paenibacillus terricola TaxID=2763503 RepID=A0ABR8MYH6_9BACL|nr:phospholipase D-like domain-containing protein DpdK [Paenibacillus terricola]MBD3920998.1 phosphatidylserine/phosphatidylglycerophosphate/cardiolipin synthase family protein [Paenibacillus terricola]